MERRNWMSLSLLPIKFADLYIIEPAKKEVWVFNARYEGGARVREKKMLSSGLLILRATISFKTNGNSFHWKTIYGIRYPFWYRQWTMRSWEQSNSLWVRLKFLLTLFLSLFCCCCSLTPSLTRHCHLLLGRRVGGELVGGKRKTIKLILAINQRANNRQSRESWAEGKVSCYN